MTTNDPHLFDRFLDPERKGMPDIGGLSAPSPDPAAQYTEMVLATLAGQLQRWSESDLSDIDALALVRRAGHKLARVCWCSHDVCCAVHDTHVTPHRNCILR